MARSASPDRACWPVDAWPSKDRLLWLGAIDKGLGPFSGQGRGAHLRPASLRKYAGGYGRWLAFLAGRDWLDPDETPSARVTRHRLAAYYDALRGQGNADASILGRFVELERLLQLIDPRPELSEITTPDGHFIGGALPNRQRAIAVHDPGELLAWGTQLFDEGLLTKSARRRFTLVRNGLMIELLSLLGLRVRSLLALEIGSTLVRGEDAVWRIGLAPEHTKNHRALDVRWPSILVPHLERYLDTERREMLRGSSASALWIGRGGKPLGVEGVTHAIATLSAARFGKDAAFRSHRFRHCIASAAPFLMPEAPNVAASVLNIGGGTVSENYVRGGAIRAARAYHAVIERLRNGTG
jgi:integrase